MQTSTDLSHQAAARRPPASRDSAAPAASQRRVLAEFTLLVVDDDQDVRETLAEAFEELGATVATASDGQKAIDVMTAGLVPTCIVLDLMMPRVTGWGVWDWVRANGTHRHVAVVVLTASGLTQGAVGEARVLKKGLGIDDIAKAILETVNTWR